MPRLSAPSLDDLFLAFRQAKVAIYFERRGVGLLELARFENRLEFRLRKLQQLLKSNDGWFDGCPIGKVCLVPKRLAPVDVPEHEHEVVTIGGTSNDRASRTLDLQVRLAPTPEFATIEVLFLWKYGRLLDGLLSKESTGYRLACRGHDVDRTSRWIFEYWRRCYQKFRTEPIDAAQAELRSEESSVTVLTADLAGFYDTICPDFLLSDAFIDQLKAKGLPPEEVVHYRAAAGSLIGAFTTFRSMAARVLGWSPSTGVPIGGLTSRVISNVALATFDAAIVANSSVVCYRRYVDDFVVVARSRPGHREAFREVLPRLVPKLTPQEADWTLDCDALERPGCTFRLQTKKIKIHRLTGVQGQEFLAAISRDFGALVSESRAFIDRAVLNEDNTARLLGVGKVDGSPIRVLRDADRAKLQHFALAIGLRSIEQVSLLAPIRKANEATRRTLQTVATYIAGEVDWVEHLDLAFRVLGLVASTANWKTALQLGRWMDATWGTETALRSSVGALSHQGREVEGRNAWKNLQAYLQDRRVECVSGAIWCGSKDTVPSGIAVGSAGSKNDTDAAGFVRRARQLAAADLRKRDREDDSQAIGNVVRRRPLTLHLASEELRARITTIGRFIELCRELGDEAWAIDPIRLFLSPRPPSYFDVARRWLHRVDVDGFSNNAFDELLELVNAIRGTRYQDPVGRVIDPATVEVPIDNGRPIIPDADPTIVLGNLTLPHDYFRGASARVQGSAVGRPVLTVERLIDLGEILDRAASLARLRKESANPGPCLLILPELAVPRAWFRSTANHAIRIGHFGLVTGLEYLHDLASPTVRNQAYAVLPGPCASVATWPFTKGVPAREEAEELAKRRPRLQFPPVAQTRRRTIVHSPYGRFSVLICSEMLEARLAAALLGKVEVVVAPSWNTDTASYDHLIQSIGLQLHAIVAVANNGYYSDCRVWAPQRTRWERDLCRLVERGRASVVSVEVPLNSLREFQAAEGARARKGGIGKRGGWRPLPPDWP